MHDSETTFMWEAYVPWLCMRCTAVRLLHCRVMAYCCMQLLRLLDEDEIVFLWFFLGLVLLEQKIQCNCDAFCIAALLCTLSWP